MRKSRFTTEFTILGSLSKKLPRCLQNSRYDTSPEPEFWPIPRLSTAVSIHFKPIRSREGHRQSLNRSRDLRPRRGRWSPHRRASHPYTSTKEKRVAPCVRPFWDDIKTVYKGFQPVWGEIKAVCRHIKASEALCHSPETHVPGAASSVGRARWNRSLPSSPPRRLSRCHQRPCLNIKLCMRRWARRCGAYGHVEAAKQPCILCFRTYSYSVYAVHACIC